MKLLELIKEVKIDLTQVLIELDTGSTIDFNFEISPKDFLNYSKQDFKDSNKKGYINALTNAKRAIDCQIDKIFHSIGIVSSPENWTV